MKINVWGFRTNVYEPVPIIEIEADMVRVRPYEFGDAMKRYEVRCRQCGKWYRFLKKDNPKVKLPKIEPWGGEKPL